MKVSRKIIIGIIFIGLVIWNYVPAFAQTMTVNFHPDGSMTSEHDSPKGYSLERYDDQMRVLEVLHYFPGGVRMKMFSKYRYENNMLVEEVSYIYTQGYEKYTYKFNEFGYETEYKHYISQTEGNWIQDHYMIQEYDERNNRSYFRAKGTAHGETNRMSRTNYDYANRTRSVVEYKFDANDREISSRSFRNRLADWQFERAGKFVFDIKKHGANLRSKRFVTWVDSDQNGNRIEQFFINSNTISRTIDQNGRVIKIQLGDDDRDENNNPIYTYDEVIDFRYDRDGRLIETVSKHYQQKKEKTTYKRGRKIEAKHYRMNNSGNWSFVDSKSYNSIELFTPPNVRGGSQAVAATSVQQNVGVISQNPAVQNPGAVAEKPQLTQSLVTDLNGLSVESGGSESLSAFKLDAEKLQHIADVLSHATGTNVSKEKVLALAMQLLIDNYNADLREMNTAYLRDKVSVFD